MTGGGRGIGRAIAARLAADGLRVAVNDVDAESASAVAEAIGGVAAPFDVADADAVEAGVADAERTLGPIDVLVANHAYMEMSPFLETGPDTWRRTLDVNLLGSAWLLDRVAPGMAARGRGWIVIIASEWGQIGWPQATAYAASKGGLIALAKSAARALGRSDVAVNAVAPGVTDTPQLEVDARAAGISRAQMVEAYGEQVPLGRVNSAEDVASVVAFLCGPHALALVGQVLAPNGGTTRI